ncbi:Protein kinase-like protein [Gracilaria domingensis]|nr:Protein kinase-like protein [Gracilaria domingensis]
MATITRSRKPPQLRACRRPSRSPSGRFPHLNCHRSPASTTACSSQMAFIATRPLTRHLTLAPYRHYSRISPRRPYASVSGQTAERGFDLLRSDVSRLSRLFRGDLSAILDKSFSLNRYDATAIAKYYDARPFTAAVRVTSIGVPFLIWLFRVRKWDKWRGAAGQEETTAMRAEQLRRLLTWAGPTYLKVGQAVGNRPDLVGVVYSNELQKLVDDVGTFDGNVAVKMVCEELQLKELSDLFSEFGVEAVASASLGQVHYAQLKNGERVAVKVQRPTVERDAALDVYVLRKVAQYAKKRFKLRSDIVGIVDEFATRLWEELDYVNEADNCERFERLYAKSNDDVIVPRIHRNLTTKKILTMEWIDGDKAPWMPKEEAQRLIRIGVQCSLQQLLDKGFVHADPHGGNLLRSKEGKLCYLDFGMCVEVEQETRYNLIAAIVRLINRDYENLAVDFVKLGFLPPDADTEPLVPLLAAAFGDASTSSALSDLSFSRLTNNLSDLAFKTPIRIPVFFTLIIRSLTILEGFALQTDSAFKIVDESYPYVVQRILTDDSPVFQRALENVLIDQDTGRIRWNRFNSLLSTRSSSLPQEDDPRGTGKIRDTSVSKGNALDKVSNTALSRVIDFTLSPRGDFLRRALQLELADTADAVQLALLKRFSDATYGLLPSPREDVDMGRVEAAIELAKLIRVRAPEVLSTFSNDEPRSRQLRRERQRLLTEKVIEASRAVAGSIAERNTIRVLRKAINTIFGRREEK